MSSRTEPLYKLWQGMRRRCSDPKKTEYKYYGARGIAVCERWQSFAAFKEDMGPRPPGTSLDRIDPDGGYSPSNCRWATIAEQNSNKRDTILVEIEGVTKSLTAWSRERGISPQAVHYRVRRLGLTPVEALSFPANRRTRHSPIWAELRRDKDIK